MKELLTIAYYYPPLGGIGALRPLHFSRYLPNFGWRSSVVSVSNDTNYLHDNSLMQLVPKGQTVYRAYRPPVFETIRRFARKGLRKYPLAYSFLDPQFDWVPNAISAGLKLAKTTNFNAILATAPPFSAIRVASKLKKKLKIPIVADLRDPFTINVMNWPSKYHRKFYEVYWRKLLASFDRAIVLADFVIDHLVESLGLSHLEPVLIPNGYDPEDFDGLKVNPPSDRFLLGYAGSFYGKMTPEPLFKSLKLAFKDRPEMRDDIQISFMGRMSEGLILGLARKYELEREVQLLGFREHRYAIDFIRGCHVLLLFTGMVYKSASGKIFEYAASGRPVLSFGVQEFTSKFIEENHFGYSVDGSNPKDGAEKIVELYDGWKSEGGVFTPSPEKYTQYSRKQLTGKLADLLDELA